MEDIMTFSKNKLKMHCYGNWLERIENAYPIHGSVIRELIAMKEGRGTRIFSNEECNYIINFLCTLQNEEDENYFPLHLID